MTTAPLYALLTLLAQAPKADLVTVSERSGFKQTGRYEETIRLCQAFQKAYPRRVRCDTFGQTPERRPMLALVVSEDGVLDPKQARAKARPVALFQGGIHAGEIDGKDAGFWLLRDLLDGKALPGVLKQLTLVFVPVFNVDGHERFGPNHRPNQVGPEQMGWRVTSQNLNLNRDYAKAEAPEMQAMIQLLLKWEPVLYGDLHVTDGAKFQHDVSVTFQPLEGSSTAQVAATRALSAELVKGLEAKGHLPVTFYPSFNDEDDPKSGFSSGYPPPRFSTAYWGLHDRIAVLVETHSWKDYATRVKVTRDTMEGLLALAARDGAAWAKEAQAAQERKLGGTSVALTYKLKGPPKPIKFLGYEYVREKSAVSGKMWIRYDDTKPQTWEVPYTEQLEPALTVTAPKAGYVVTAGFAELVEKKLAVHGLKSQRLKGPRPGLAVEVFRATEAQAAPRSFEGRQQLTVSGAWAPEQRDLPDGSLFVPIDQRFAALLLQLLEPGAPDSLLAWGYFNACFERKEYLEDYVAEQVAREQLKDPAVKAEFERTFKGDAGTPDARLAFFAKRHLSWDERLNLYPVYRVAQAP